MLRAALDGAQEECHELELVFVKPEPSLLLASERRATGSARGRESFMGEFTNAGVRARFFHQLQLIADARSAASNRRVSPV
jgi:hypothetical protein